MTTQIATTTTISETNAARAYLARLAPGARRTMEDALGVVAVLAVGGDPTVLTRSQRMEAAAACPWASLRYQHTQAIRAQLVDRYAHSTANKLLAALRGVLLEAWRLGQMSAEDYHRASDLDGVRGSTLPAGRMLEVRELASLFAACSDGTAGGARDAALLAIEVGAGLRQSEAVALEVADYDGASLKVRRGKGNKQRLVPIHNGTKDAIDAWLRVRGPVAGPLLCPVNKSGVVDATKGMTTQAAFNALARRGEKAGLQHFSPHDLRRTCISRQIDASGDLPTVQALAGHANVSTTARYDRRGDEVKRRLVAMVSVPYVAA